MSFCLAILGRFHLGEAKLTFFKGVPVLCGSLWASVGSLHFPLPKPSPEAPPKMGAEKGPKGGEKATQIDLSMLISE